MRTAGARVPQAATTSDRSESSGEAFSVSVSLVQTGVQTPPACVISPLAVPLCRSSPQIVDLRVGGSSPLSHPLKFCVNF